MMQNQIPVYNNDQYYSNNTHHNNNQTSTSTSVTPQPNCFSWNPYRPSAPKTSHHIPCNAPPRGCFSDTSETESQGTSLHSGSEDIHGVSSWDVSTTSSYGTNAPAPAGAASPQIPAYQMEIPAFKMAARRNTAPTTSGPQAQQPRGHFVPPTHGKDSPIPTGATSSLQAPLMHHKPTATAAPAAVAAPPLRRPHGGQAAAHSHQSTALPDVGSLSVPQWVHYVRSITQDDRMKEVIEGLGAPMQLAMLDSILIANEEEHGHALAEEGAAFRNHCVRDRGNVIIFLMSALMAKQPTAQHKARLQDQYSPVILSHLLSHWTPIVTSQFGVLAVPRIRLLLNQQGQEALARQALADVLSLGCNQYGNYILKDIIRMASTTPQHFDFVFRDLGAELSLPGRFAQLAQSRYGSHIIEAFLEVAPRHHKNAVCDAVLEAAIKLGGTSAAAAPRHNLIVSLGFHKQANYALQAIFKAIEVGSSQEAVATSQVLPLLQVSSFYRYLVKALKKTQKK